MKILKKNVPLFFVILFVFFSSTTFANSRNFNDYQSDLWGRFLDKLPNGINYFPEWSFSGQDERSKIVDCLEKAFDYFIELQDQELLLSGPVDEFKTYQHQCDNLEPHLNFLIKAKNLRRDFFEVTFFQDKMLGKGGFKMIYPGINVLFMKNKKVDYQHVIVGSFIRPNEYYYYKKKEIERFRRLGKPIKLVERYGFYDTDIDSHYLSQKRYLSWKEFHKNHLPNLSLKHKKAIIEDMLEGIRHIHSTNNVHGDIKETNLFFVFNQKENRYMALVGDLDGLGPVGSADVICTRHYLTNYNFVQFNLGRGLVVKKEDDLFAASIVAEVIMAGKSEVYTERSKDLNLPQPLRYISIKKHNKRCKQVSYEAIKSQEITTLINNLRCKSTY